MSKLESATARVLTPIILGNPASIMGSDQPLIAVWAHKTVLVNMLVSSEKDRSLGYGLPASEYRALYNVRDQRIPIAKTQFWIGRYHGQQKASVCVTPLVVKISGLMEPANPQAYAMTLVLGELLLHGVRFTTPGLEFDVTPHHNFHKIWPPNNASINWPAENLIGDETLLGVEKGLELKSTVPNSALAPWRTATELSESRAKGPLVELPTPCGKHSVYYPAVLAHHALRGIFYAFTTSCECGINYLVMTESDGAHFKAEAKGREVETIYDKLPEEELSIQDEGGIFFCKSLSSPPPRLVTSE